MSETLARRVGRLVSGGFHAILDAAENFIYLKWYDLCEMKCGRN